MKRLVLGTALIAAVVLSIPASASAAEYDTYVGCGTAVTTPPSAACVVGSPVGLFFESDEETEYEVCVEFPDGLEECAEEQEAEAGVLTLNELVTEELGTYLVYWYVGLAEVGSASFRLDPAPAPPTPPTPPAPPASPAPPAPTPAPAPAPAPAPPAKSVACVKAEKRIKQLRGQVQNADGKDRKATLRGKLKGARTAAKKAC
jgi:hypothetical protein